MDKELKDGELSFDELFAQAIADEEDGDGVVEVEHNDEVDDNVNAQSSNAPVVNQDSNDASVDNDVNDTGSNNNEDNVDYKALYEQEKQRTSSWSGRLSARDREIQSLKEHIAGLSSTAQAQRTDETNKEIANDIFSDSEVKAFTDEFPELANPIRKMVELAVEARTKEAARNVVNEVEGRFEPLKKTVAESIAEKHHNTIRAAHDDFTDIVTSGDLLKWVEEQPAYLYDAYKRIYDMGQANEVVDLISRYKSERGITPSSGPSSQVTEQINTNNTKRPSAAVKSRPSQAPIQRKKVDPNDFQAAWEEALKTK